MGYAVEISRRDVSGNAEDGTPLDGDVREIRDYGTETEVYDTDDAEDYGSPVGWAVAVVGKTNAIHPSIDPVGSALSERAWLSGTYVHPYLDQREEISVYLTGDWTPAQRAEVFRAVS